MDWNTILGLVIFIGFAGYIGYLYKKRKSSTSTGGSTGGSSSGKKSNEKIARK